MWESILWFLIFGGAFYLMMRMGGCGMHTHGRHGGAVLRLRPILMTASVTVLGLLPLLFARVQWVRGGKTACNGCSRRSNYINSPYAPHYSELYISC